MTTPESTTTATPEFPNFIGLLAEVNHGNAFGRFLHTWESAIYALLVIAILAWVASAATRRSAIRPGRLQNAAEFLVTFVDDFVCLILGPKGRKFTPFIGTLFIYILAMNYIGLIPFFKSPTADWSTTMALALIVFVSVQVVAFRELGFLGYFDHLAGQPSGIFAWLKDKTGGSRSPWFLIVVLVLAVGAGALLMGLFMFSLHLVSELVRPFSLSLRLRSNIYGDDMILALFASWGIKDGFMWLFPNFLMVFLTSTIQAAVFSILTLVYFSLIMKHEDVKH